MSQFDAIKNIRPEQRRAANVLLTGGSKQNAADAGGVSVRTIERWQHEPAFVEYLRAGAGQALQTAAIRITALLDLALGVLYEIMTEPGARQGIKLLEIKDVLERLDAIEASLGTSK